MNLSRSEAFICYQNSMHVTSFTECLMISSLPRTDCTQDEVAPKHVKEAYRLLNKSIIRVEQPDVQLDEQEEPLGDVDEEETPEEADAENVAPPVNGIVNGGVNGEHPPPKEKEKEKKKKLKLSFEEYKSIANLLVLHLRCV